MLGLFLEMSKKTLQLLLRFIKFQLCQVANQTKYGYDKIMNVTVDQ